MRKIIDDFPNYDIDEDGVVRRVKNGKVISQQTYAGYKCVSLRNGGKSKWNKVHRLVASAFIPNPKSLPCVNHKDENKLNNSVNNLEWCDYSYNNSYGKNAPLKRMSEARRKKVGMYDASGELLSVFDSATDAERDTGIKQSNISKCCLNRPSFNTAGGYVWKFIK